MIIYGKNPVKEFLLQPSSNIREIFISRESKRGAFYDLIKLAENRDIKISFPSREHLSKISDTNSHQGIAASISDFEYSEVSNIFNIAKHKGDNLFVVILDHIEDPQNFGAIIRSVNVLGAHGVIIPKNRSVSVTPAVVKASAGAVGVVPVSRVVNIVRVLKKLKKKGVWIVGADHSARKSVYEEELGGLDIALVIGSEGKGLKRLVKEECDFLLSIPNIGEVSSLNASVGAGIMIYEIMRQRKKVKD